MMHNRKVEAEDLAPIVVYFHGTVCDPDPIQAAGQCRFEVNNDNYPRCDCKTVGQDHQCECMAF
ncbi:unnamed protein product [Arabis nemorensis]|uniref:Uncharacterized protein n=1 Tax=Arabis nemorensis TaxID=586526 RepID=A0A565B468_9BRAS|nr:unnamed protein product [Arabis nemorensis]